MILGNKTNYEEWRTLHSCLELNLLELANARLVWQGRNSYSFNRCFIVLAGDGEIHNHTEEQILPLVPGTACFMPQNLDLSFNFRLGLNLLSIHFNAYILPGMDIFAGKTKCMAFPIAQEWRDECMALLPLTPNWQTFCHFESLLWKLLANLTSLDVEKFHEFSQLHAKYEKILNYIHNNINATTSIQELCDMSGMNRDTLSRKFSRDFGISLKSFLMSKQISRAERYLLQTKMPIRDIAYEMKFSSEFYFSSFFKRLKGVTPSEFRNMQKKYEECVTANYDIGSGDEE